MDTILISNFVVLIRIGLSAQERALAQRVRIDLTVTTDFTETIQTESLEHGVNYACLRRSLEELAARGEFVLLETLGHCIITHLLAHARISRVTVTLQKLDVWQNGVPGIMMTRGRARPTGTG